MSAEGHEVGNGHAEELIQHLSREANQARQAEITQEISEIAGGAGPSNPGSESE